jgi:hypothetical protein
MSNWRGTGLATAAADAETKRAYAPQCDPNSDRDDLFRLREVGLQQLRHGTLIEPLQVHTKFAAWIDQSIHYQQLQHLRPGHRFSLHRLRQLLFPKLLQLLPQLTPQPAVAEARGRSTDLRPSNPEKKTVTSPLGLLWRGQTHGEPGTTSQVIRPSPQLLERHKRRPQ